ncbi:nitroreductase family protein [Pedobacter immunditicola]|uniref:nitroreductase family protein n=1 Tax=Pedobacter immunditicola TaxID=3133440 RepID=UPI0030ACFFA6
MSLQRDHMAAEINILTEIIQRRRSIFPINYNQKEVPVEVIKQLLENANYAPTHKLTEPWRFVVFRGEGKKRLGFELARIYKDTTPPALFLQKKYDSITAKIDQASCVIALNAQLHPEKLPEWEEVASLACAVQNMALTAEALNVGAYWSSPGLITELGEFLNLAENEKCYGFFYMGYYEEEPAPVKRTPIATKVTWVED